MQTDLVVKFVLSPQLRNPKCRSGTPAMRRLRRQLVVVVRRLQMGLLKLLISSPSGKSVFANFTE